ncbi:MAG: phosphoribosylglycinamide formyltransferase [Opitutales bacterium]|nr:phosphoribosylglycinamide formyltransferase [Opitutales bacterium]
MKIVIIGSGTGSNAEAILECWKQGNLGKAVPVAIFSDKPEARILTLGAKYGVKAAYVDPGRFKTKLDDEAEARYVDAIRAEGADLVVLAGFMRVLHETFLNAFEGRIINLHPSLLPAFPGLHSIEQAFNYGAKYSGCTVHWVTAGLDMGPIIDQSAVRIEANDTLDTLESKVHAAEHSLLPAVIAKLAERS